MVTTTYNGWTNYETWCVNLWLTNEEYSASQLEQLVDSDDDPLSKRSRLQYWVVEDFGVLDIEGMAGDLLGMAFERVNWQEIIENHTDD